MSTQTRFPSPPDIEHPESDGQPMSDNTLQFRWIVTIEGNLEDLLPISRMCLWPATCSGIRWKATT
jgi:hypothetical protein